MQRQGEFAESVASRIGRRVEQLRTRVQPDGKKLTVQGLADRCAGLGLPLDRSVLAKLEKGLRQTITMGEILVLSRALGVPPVSLIFPLGDDPDVEVLPGLTIPTWYAVKWFTGEAPLATMTHQGEWFVSAKDVVAAMEALIPLNEYRRHDRLVEQRRDALMNSASARRYAIDSDDPAVKRRDERLAETESERAREYERAIVECRSLMRSRGLVLPGLPHELMHLDNQQEGQRHEQQTDQETT